MPGSIELNFITNAWHKEVIKLVSTEFKSLSNEMTFYKVEI